MLAVDTNVVVRYLTRDDARQAASAAALIDGGPVFIPTTVFLEAEWVLRSLYRMAPDEIVSAFRTLAGQPTVSLEQPAAMSSAFSWSELGLDLADALHLAASQHCDAFISFDKALAKLARRVGELPVREP